jgi:hypothetical protein
VDVEDGSIIVTFPTNPDADDIEVNVPCDDTWTVEICDEGPDTIVTITPPTGDTIVPCPDDDDRIYLYHTVIFDLNGGTFAGNQALLSQQVRHGSNAVEPSPATKSGFDFDGWTPEFTNPIRSSVTHVARWDDAIVFTLTFHLYTDRADIINRFKPYTTDIIDDRAVIVVPVTPGAPRQAWEGYDLLADALAIGHIHGMVNAPGHAFWGWFTDATLNVSGRTNITSGLRRPALANICQIYEYDNLGRGYGDRLLRSIENATSDFAIYSLFGNVNGGNIDMYAIWSLWGDVDDNDEVDLEDLGLLRNYIMMRDMPGVVIHLNRRAGDVEFDQRIDLNDVGLLRNYIMMRDMPGVTIVLGAPPAP